MTCRSWRCLMLRSGEILDLREMFEQGLSSRRSPAGPDETAKWFASGSTPRARRGRANARLSAFWTHTSSSLWSFAHSWSGHAPLHSPGLFCCEEPGRATGPPKVLEPILEADFYEGSYAYVLANAADRFYTISRDRTAQFRVRCTVAPKSFRALTVLGVG